MIFLKCYGYMVKSLSNFIKVKKKVVISISFCLISLFFNNVLFAGIGIKGGVSVAGILSTSYDYTPFLGFDVSFLQGKDNRPLWSFQVGMFNTFKISRYFDFQPEIFYSVRGLDFSDSYMYRITYKVKINYIELPLLLKYKIPLKGSLKPNIFFGPYVALNISAKKITEIWKKKEISDLKNVKKLDYGLVFGGCTRFDLFSGKLIFDIRLNLGLAGIMTKHEDYLEYFNSDASARNLVIVVMTGFQF